MFLIMGFVHIVAAFILFLSGSSDAYVHFTGGMIELIIGAVIFFKNDCNFEI